VKNYWRILTKPCGGLSMALEWMWDLLRIMDHHPGFLPSGDSSWFLCIYQLAALFWWGFEISHHFCYFFHIFTSPMWITVHGDPILVHILTDLTMHDAHVYYTRYTMFSSWAYPLRMWISALTNHLSILTAGCTAKTRNRSFNQAVIYYAKSTRIQQIRVTVKTWLYDALKFECTILL